MREAHLCVLDDPHGQLTPLAAVRRGTQRGTEHDRITRQVSLIDSIIPSQPVPHVRGTRLDIESRRTSGAFRGDDIE